MEAKHTWVSDEAIGEVEYLETRNDQLYASVDVREASSHDCRIWMPGCGFDPVKTRHATIAEAKQHAEQQLSLMGAVFRTVRL